MAHFAATSSYENLLIFGNFQVVFLMYLWSIDFEATCTALSCFNLLCEEAEIRCSSDEVVVTALLPNYHVYQELAQTTSMTNIG